MMFAQDCNRCVGGKCLTLGVGQVCITCGPTVGPPVHARAGHSQVTWCGLPAVHVARALEVDEISCARCRALQGSRHERRKAAALAGLPAPG